MVITHELNAAAGLADRVLILHEGGLLHSLPFSELIASKQLFVRARVQHEPRQTLSVEDCFSEYRADSWDLERVE